MDSIPSAILTSNIRDEGRRLLGSLLGERQRGLFELVGAINYYCVYILGRDESKREEEIDSER